MTTKLVHRETVSASGTETIELPNHHVHSHQFGAGDFRFDTFWHRDDSGAIQVGAVSLGTELQVMATQDPFLAFPFRQQPDALHFQSDPLNLNVGQTVVFRNGLGHLLIVETLSSETDHLTLTFRMMRGLSRAILTDEDGNWAINTEGKLSIPDFAPADRQVHDHDLFSIGPAPDLAQSTEREQNIGTSPSPAMPSPQVIQDKIVANLDSASQLSVALKLLINEELDLRRSTIPNEPEKLEAHHKYIAFLERLEMHFDRLMRALDMAGSTNVAKAQTAAPIVAALRDEVAGWIESNKTTVVDSTARVGLIGVACGFLTLCGAPAWPAIAIPALLLGGAKVLEAIKVKDDEK